MPSMICPQSDNVPSASASFCPTVISSHAGSSGISEFACTMLETRLSMTGPRNWDPLLLEEHDLEEDNPNSLKAMDTKAFLPMTPSPNDFWVDLTTIDPMCKTHLKEATDEDEEKLDIKARR